MKDNRSKNNSVW